MDSGDIFEVIVVGAGVMGSSTAYQIAKCSGKVLLLEQFDLLHQHGSSHEESRAARVTYSEDYYLKMVLKSEKLWQESEAEVGYKVYFKSSHLDIGPTDIKSLQAAISTCRNNSIPVGILDHVQTHQEFTGKFQIGDDWIGAVTEHDGVLKPTKVVAMFQALAIKHGACLKDNSVVEEIRKGVYGGSSAISASGAWMQKLVKTISGLKLPVQPVETTIYYWKIREGHEDFGKIYSSLFV